MKRTRLLVAAVLAGMLSAGIVIYGRTAVERIAYAVETGQSEALKESLAELSSKDVLSVLFRQVGKLAKPAVVEVRVTKWIRRPDPGELFRRFFGDKDLPFKFRIPRDGQQQPRMRQMGLGSGVVIDAENGYVLTNNHVVAGADEVEVVLADNRKFEAVWVRTDPATDLAVVKIKPDRLCAIELGDSDKVSVGDWVLAIGSPRGLPQTVTAGIISAKGRSTGRTRLYQNYLQTDAAINKGNSGGPLVNMKGQVIGINNLIASYSGGNEGIGFAIPSNMAKGIMKQLIRTGKVVRGFLGVNIQNVDEGLAKSFKLPHTEGALVGKVVKGSAADAAKMKIGDFITHVDGRKVRDVNQLRNAVAALAPGKTVNVKIIRDGKTRTLEVKLGAKPEQVAFASDLTPGTAAAGAFGLKVATLTKDLAAKYGHENDVRGVVITEVAPESDAAEQDLREGMVITHIDGKPVSGSSAFAKSLSARADGVRLRVTDSKGGQRFVFITPATKK